MGTVRNDVTVTGFEIMTELVNMPLVDRKTVTVLEHESCELNLVIVFTGKVFVVVMVLVGACEFPITVDVLTRVTSRCFVIVVLTV